MPDFPGLKLGRKAIKIDPRTLKLGRYLTASLPPAPMSVDWTKGKTAWNMLANDSLGDCTIAGALHQYMVWTVNQNEEVTTTDSEAVAYYEKWCGYNPADPSTDQGGILLDILKQWKAETLNGNVIDSYANVNTANTQEVKQAINLFGGLYVGVALPISAQAQTANGQVWDVSTGTDGQSGSWGGHCIEVCAYDANGLTCITWGVLQKMTWDFWSAYVDEAYCIISPSWLNKTSQAPSGFDLTQLQQDLLLIT